MDNCLASEEPAPSPQDNLETDKHRHQNHKGHYNESPLTMANLPPVHAQKSSCAVDSKWRELACVCVKERERERERECVCGGGGGW